MAKPVLNKEYLSHLKGKKKIIIPDLYIAYRKTMEEQGKRFLPKRLWVKVIARYFDYVWGVASSGRGICVPYVGTFRVG